MEIWFNSSKNKVRLPVLPPSMIISGGTVETSMNMLGNGEASLYSGNKVQEGEITCFFPARKNIDSYKFLQYQNPARPYYFVSLFRGWMNSGEVVQFVVTPDIASFPVRIVSFEYGEKDGSSDVYYTLKWKEVRKITVKKLNSNTNNNSNNNERPTTPTTNNNNNNNNKKVHKVVKGDNLYDLAAKYYGNGKLYPKIKEANNAKYPSLKSNNIIYVNWELVIP